MTVLKRSPRWRDVRRPSPHWKDGTSDTEELVAGAKSDRADTEDTVLGRRVINKSKGKEWRTHYHLSVEIGLALSLFLLAAVMRAPIYQSSGTLDIQLAQQEVVTMEEIQQTKQVVKPPPPPRPPVPVEVADDTVMDDEELNLDVTLDITETPAYVPPPPKAPVEEEPEEDLDEIFVVVEQMPEIVGGPGKIYDYLEYPVIARQAQMEGLVVVQIVVEPDGTGSSPRVVKSAGQILDDAAVAAVLKLKFKPGMQRGRAVRVNMAIPIRFMLREREK
ncbi:MAG: energy transducer TonB [Rhodothermia bacterium]|nr:energy transducer TonB [Rhodothermia bacterium]